MIPDPVMEIHVPITFPPKIATQSSPDSNTSVESGASPSSEPKVPPSLGAFADLPRSPRLSGTPLSVNAASSRRNSIIGTKEVNGTELPHPLHSATEPQRPQQPHHAYGTYESHGAWNNEEIQQWADLEKKIPKMESLDDLKSVLQSVKNLTDGKAEKVQGQAILHVVKNDLAGHLDRMTPAQLATMLEEIRDLPQGHINLFVNKLQKHFLQKFRNGNRASLSETQEFIEKAMKTLGPKAMAALSPNRNQAFELAWQLSN